MFCTYCGKNLEDIKGHFCSGCGKEIEKKMENKEAIINNIDNSNKNTANILKNSESTAKSLKSEGISAIGIGAAFCIMGIISDFYSGPAAPSVLTDDTYLWWMLVIGVLSIIAGILCIVNRNDPNKFNMLIIVYAILSILFLIYVFTTGYQIASYFGVSSWIMHVILPLKYIFGVITISNLKKKQ